ncbi:MAG: hypothetical protein O3C34_21415, partial [Proteobacteria bacterium]|nr:hypothetical protein [Pseudomonadota bacterium]
LDAAVKAAAGNLALVEIDTRVKDILVTFTAALREQGIKPLLTDRGRRDALWAGLEAVAANPKFWAELTDQNSANLLQPLVAGLLKGLKSDPTKLLTGPALVEAFRRTLTALGRRGGDWVKTRNAGADIEILVTAALKRASAELAKSIDGENLPEFVERAMLGFLDAVSVSAGQSPDVKKILDTVIEAIKD